MKGIVGNALDTKYLERLGYKIWRNDGAGNVVFDKHHVTGTKRLAFNYMDRVFWIINYDLDLHAIGKAKNYQIARLRDLIFD